MRSFVVVLVLLVVGIGLPFAALAADRYAARLTSVRPRFDLEAETQQLAARHHLTYAQMQTVRRTVDRGEPIASRTREAATGYAELVLRERDARRAALPRLRRWYPLLATVYVVAILAAVAWSWREGDGSNVVFLGPPALFAVSLWVQRRRFANAERVLTADTPVERGRAEA